MSGEGEAEGIVLADFHGDVRRHLALVLTQSGIALPADKLSDTWEVCKAYFNVRTKVIEPRPRQVHQSRELRTKQLPDEVERGVQLIHARAIAGDSLVDQLSLRALRPHTHDWLLNDWGIHHLHVRYGRGSELLYVWVASADLYFIDVCDHESMADVGLLEIVLRNWPTLLIPMGLKASENPNSAELDQLRRAGVTCPVSLSDGQVYYPRGGGLMSAGGLSARVVDAADDLLNRTIEYEQAFRDHAPKISQDLHVKQLRLHFNLVENSVVEVTTGRVWASAELEEMREEGARRAYEGAQ